MLVRGKPGRDLRVSAIVIMSVLGVVALGAAVGTNRLIEKRPISFTSGVGAEECVGAAALDFACHEAHLRSLVLSGGSDAAFSELKADFASIGLVRAGCHQLTHAIGRAAADLSGRISGAYAEGDPFCSAGYYHGAAEAVVVQMGAATALNEASAICEDLGPHERRSIVHRNCAHGVGHGFMRVYANDVPLSLAGCDALNDAWERESCFGGTFMENTVVAVSDPDQSTTYADSSRPLFPCNELADRYRRQCYAKHAAFALYTLDGDFGGAFALCATVEAAYRPACNEGLGTGAAVNAAKYVIGDTNQAHFVRETCLLAPDERSRASCVVGAARAIVNYHQEDDGPQNALCDAFELDLRRTCLSSVAEKKVWPE
jgi:hypothetical protein